MAYVQVEADEVRILLSGLLQHLILVYSNTSRKGQKLSSSKVLPEVLELEMPTDVNVIFVQMLACSNSASGYLSEETTQQKGTGGFWTVEYYQLYFDVDTKTVRFQLLH